MKRGFKYQLWHCGNYPRGTCDELLSQHRTAEVAKRAYLALPEGDRLDVTIYEQKTTAHGSAGRIVDVTAEVLRG